MIAIGGYDEHHMESDGITLQYIYNLPPPMHWGLRLATHRLLIRLGSSLLVVAYFDVRLIERWLVYVCFFDEQCNFIIAQP